MELREGQSRVILEVEKRKKKKKKKGKKGKGIYNVMLFGWVTQ